MIRVTGRYDNLTGAFAVFENGYEVCQIEIVWPEMTVTLHDSSRRTIDVGIGDNGETSYRDAINLAITGFGKSVDEWEIGPRTENER